MRKIAPMLVRILGTLVKIDSLELEKNIKKIIKKIYLYIIFHNLIDSKNTTLNVAGYKINYRTYGTFRYLFQEIFVDQDYYFTTESRRPLIIDCGSNIGMSILYFKLMYPNSRIIAFEPDEDAFLCLKENVEDNDLQSVELNNKAVSDNDGKIAFYYDMGNPGSLTMSTCYERMPKQKKEVDAVQLSKYLNEEVDFLKIDIEGAELGVIQELNNSGKLNHVKQMAIEYHHHIIENQDGLSTILGVLENAGFGYQISSALVPPFSRHTFQDILIYAYQKKFVSIFNAVC